MKVFLLALGLLSSLAIGEQRSRLSNAGTDFDYRGQRQYKALRGYQWAKL
jgi:hypothetical protein